MESTKYYTPSLDEFYVGFKFERRENLWESIEGSSWKSNHVGYTDWVKCSNFSEEFMDYDVDSIEEVERYIEEGNIRVKYLDIEDIDDSGFILETLEIGIAKFYHTFYVGVWLNFLQGKHVEIGQHKETFFSGTIKNISELKKLLKQLNIS